MQFTINLKAGQRQPQKTAGSYFMILDDGGSGAVIDTTFRDHTQIIEEIRTAMRGTKARMARGQFTSVEMVADRDCALEVVISDGAIDVDLFAGASVKATIVNPLPLPVIPDRGAPGNPVYVNTALAGLPAAVAIVDDAAAAVTAALTALVAANANRIRAIFTNLDPANPVAIGGAGLTWAKRAIVLQPGDTWVEERGANLAWSAICGPGLTATVGVQEVTA